MKAANYRGSITAGGYGAGNRDDLGHQRAGEICSEGEAPERKRPLIAYDRLAPRRSILAALARRPSQRSCVTKERRSTTPRDDPQRKKRFRLPDELRRGRKPSLLACSPAGHFNVRANRSLGLLGDRRSYTTTRHRAAHPIPSRTARHLKLACL